MPEQTNGRRGRSLRRCEQEYDELKGQLFKQGYVLQGSLTERWNQCGKPECRCKDDPQARHGPYYQLSWKQRGKTKSMYLDADQVQLCKEWIANHKELDRILKSLHDVSLRMVNLRKTAKK